MEEENLKCLIYARVSFESKEEKKLSPSVQVNIAKELIEKNSWTQIEPAYIDRNKTGTNTNRSGFQKMLTRCKQGGIDAVIVQDTSRLSRNTVEYLSIKQVLKDYGVQLISVNQPNTKDDNPYSQFMDEITAAVNALHPRVTSMKVKITMDAKFEFGWWPSWAPLGYLNIENPKPSCDMDEKIVAIDPEMGPLVKQAFQLYSTGNYSYLKLCEEMHSRGLRPKASRCKKISVQSMQEMLSNEFYYGYMNRNGIRKRGLHDRLISKALFDQCRYTAAKHRQFLTRKRKHTFLLRGLIFCQSHEKRLVAEWHDANSRHRDKVGYYHCCQRGGCKGSFIQIEKLEKRVASLFKKFQFSEDFISLVREKIKEHYETNTSESKSHKQALINKKKGLEAKRDKAERLLIDGYIDRNTFKRQHGEIQDQITLLEDEIVEIEQERRLDIDLTEEILALTSNIYETYTEAPDFLKRYYIRFFFEKIYVKDKRISKTIETPIFSTLKKQQALILRSDWLEDRNFNITTQLSSIIKAFSDFRLVAQIREEIERVKPSLALAT